MEFLGLRIHQPLFAVLLCAVLASFLGSHTETAKAKAKATPPQLQIAPAIAQDDSEAWRRAWLARVEFEELNLQLVGVATTSQGVTSCSITHPGSSEQMIYTVGDVIGGFRITAIENRNDNQSVTFDRAGTQFWLMLGESSGGNPAETAREGYLNSKDDLASDIASAPEAPRPVVEPQREEGIVKKLAGAAIKTKKRAYEAAKLIEDGFAERFRSSSKSRYSRELASSKGFSPASPLRGEFTSGYGYRRHPLGGDRRFHKGVDIAAEYGARIHAAEGGVVVKVYNSSAAALGRHILIKHANGFETCYGHLWKILVSEGDRVEKGQVIGREGSSGWSTGPHLHFEIHKNGYAVNPEPYIHLQ